MMLGVPLGYWAALGLVAFVIWQSGLVPNLRLARRQKDQEPLPGKVQYSSRVLNTARVVTGQARAPRWSGISSAPGPLQPAPPVSIPSLLPSLWRPITETERARGGPRITRQGRRTHG